MEQFDICSENVLFASESGLTPSSKKGFLRMPLMDVTNNTESNKPSDTPRRKSAAVENKQDLQMLNFQLKTSSQIQQEEIKSLESQLAKERAKITELEKKIKYLEHKCESLEKSLQSPVSYYHHFKQAQQIMLELQAEKREFEGLMSDMQTTAALQFRMKNTVTHAAKRLLALSKDDSIAEQLKKEIAVLQSQYSRCQEELAISDREKRQMDGDISLMQGLLIQSNNSMTELDEKWHSYHQEEKKNRDHIRQLESENASVTNTFNVMMRDKMKVEKELCQHKDKVDKMAADHEDSRTKMELYIQNLQHTLNCWEVDREIAEKDIVDLRQQLNSQQTSMKERGDLQSELEKLKSNNEILEAEIESFEFLQLDFYNVQEELSVAKDSCSALAAFLEQVHQWVEQTLSNLQQSFGVKLSITPQHSKRRVNKQSFVGEILSIADKQDSVRKGSSGVSLPNSSVKKLARPLRQDNVEFGSALKKPFVQQHQRVISSSQSLSVSMSDNKVSISTSRKRLSFRTQSESLDKNSSNLCSSAALKDTEVQRMLDREGFSKECEGGVDTSKHTASPGFARIRHIPSTANRALDDERPTDGLKSTDTSWDIIEWCESMRDSVENMLTLITRTCHVVDKASKLSMNDLNGEMDILHERLSIKNEKIRELQRDVDAKTEETQRLKGEKDGLRQRVSAMTQAILEHEDLHYEVKRLEEEKAEWRQREKRLTGEITLLSEQLKELVTKADAKHGQAKDGSCLSEIVLLKNKIYQLQCQSYEEMERHKQMATKVSRRLKITQQNWEKAEAEASDLDEIIESIRKICIDAGVTHQNPYLLHIIRLIDQPSKNTAASTSSF